MAKNGMKSSKVMPVFAHFVSKVVTKVTVIDTKVIKGFVSILVFQG